MMTENVVKTAVMAVAVVVVGVLVSSTVSGYVKVADKAALSEVVNSCMNASRVEQVRSDNGATVTTMEPMMQLYERCMNDKGR